MTAAERFAVVVPTVGRPSLARLLEALADAVRPAGAIPRLTLVDDRRHPFGPVVSSVPDALRPRIRVVRGHGEGPASARNVGWRSTSSEWIAFLDDDVVPSERWLVDLGEDLLRATPSTAAVQGRVSVPLPAGRRPSDWERNVAGLERAPWITADLAVRRRALVAVAGFDERFRRAYREDADLALRLGEAGWRLTVGGRRVEHPVRPAPWHVSIGAQRGNREDPWMRARHGRRWRERAQAPPGRRSRHFLITGAAALAGVGLATHRRSMATVGLLSWTAGVTELAVDRIAPGPRTVREVGAMAVTSVVLPFAATGWWLVGAVEIRRRRRRPAGRETVDAVLFDRDGTLVEDVPYNGDPGRVVLRPYAGAALSELRRRGVPVALVTNQSGIARGLLTDAQVRAVNARVAEMVGGLDAIEICPHAPDDACECRKPRPGMVREVARRLGVEVSRCVVVGDIGADVAAALAAGARPILVPAPATRPEEIRDAPEVAPDLLSAVSAALGEAVLLPVGPVAVPTGGRRA